MKAHRSYRYRVVDVFTTKPLQGNPLAVFPDSSGLTAETMQKIALELNLSETVFVVPSSRSECVARLRIFPRARRWILPAIPPSGRHTFYSTKGKFQRERETSRWKKTWDQFPFVSTQDLRPNYGS